MAKLAKKKKKIKRKSFRVINKNILENKKNKP